MEEKMQKELFIESNINNGCIEFAKSRYIMGQSAVCATNLPTENSIEFSASKVCERVKEDGVDQIKVMDNECEDTVNPMKWFGVLLPQSMYKAQSLFKRATEYIVDCVNIQLQLIDVMNKMKILKSLKQSLLVK